MLGQFLQRLADPAEAEQALARLARPEIRDRVQREAEVSATSAGLLVARKVRHVLEHGDEEVWLDLVAVMARSPQPGAALLDRMLARAFPDPVRVRVTRKPATTSTVQG